MECIGDGALRGHAEADRVGAGHGRVDGVFEPLTARSPAEVITSARVGGQFKIDAVGAVVVRASIGGSYVVGNTLASGVVVFSLDGAGNGGRSAAIGSFGSMRDGRHAEQQRAAQCGKAKAISGSHLHPRFL